jgi:fibronectin type III domain protein
VRFYAGPGRSGTPKYLATLTTSSYGYAWAMITIPSRAVAGPHLIDGREQATGRYVGTAFTVLPKLAPPPQPTNVRVTVLSDNSLEVDWDDVAGETGYVVDTQQALMNVAAGITTFVDSGLEPDSYHCYRVQAVNAGGSSDWSNYVCEITYHAMCAESADCVAGEDCAVGICVVDHCVVQTTSCTVAPFIVVPSDMTNLLPDDGTLNERMSAAMATVADFYRTKAGLSMRMNPPQVLRAGYDSAWFTTPAIAGAELPDIHLWDFAEFRSADANHPPIDWGRLFGFMDEAGHGVCTPGLVTLALVASTVSGGTVGSSRCGPPQIAPVDAGPDMGTGISGFAVASQWVLDTVLTGGDSESCKLEAGEGFWTCPANVSWGTIMHELGHGFGLPHPCDGWAAEHWQIPPDVCDQLVMHAHWNYPNVGFHEKEIAILELSKVFG